ncbi:MAG: M56 family metallopeptidase, partial [Acidobacteriota bacterium]
MMQSLDFMDSLAAKAMASVADGLWQGVVLVALVGVLLSVFRFANATTRFVVWCGTLLVVVSLPLVAGRFAPETRLVTSLSLAPPSVSKAMEPGAERSGAEPGATRIAPVPVPRLPFGPPRRWALYLMGAWILGGLLMLARLASSTCHLRKLKRRSLPLPGQFQGRLDRWLEVCSPGRSAVVRASEDISLPMAVGFTQPVILLPIDLVEELTGAELDQIVLHELAHLRRRDDWTKLAQKLA